MYQFHKRFDRENRADLINGPCVSSISICNWRTTPKAWNREVTDGEQSLASSLRGQLNQHPVELLVNYESHLRHRDEHLFVLSSHCTERTQRTLLTLLCCGYSDHASQIAHVREPGIGSEYSFVPIRSRACYAERETASLMRELLMARSARLFLMYLEHFSEEMGIFTRTGIRGFLSLFISNFMIESSLSFI